MQEELSRITDIFTVRDEPSPLISLISFGLCDLARAASFLGADKSFIFASPSRKAPALCKALTANLFGADVLVL